LDVINDFFQSVAISSQHLPAENYNVSSNESIGGPRPKHYKFDY